MSLTVVAGNPNILQKALLEKLSPSSPEFSQHNNYVIVPRQLTLDTERTVLNSIPGGGSFTLNVTSPHRLSAYIFEKAGRLKTLPVDDAGKAILMHQAAKNVKNELVWYKNARELSGFSAKACEQITLFKQALKSPVDLKEAASKLNKSALKNKLNDIAIIYESYEQLLKGGFHDSETSILQAIERIPKVKEFASSRAFFFGFDILPANIALMATELAKVGSNVFVFLPLKEDIAQFEEENDPIYTGFKRLFKLSKNAGIKLTRENVKDENSAKNEAQELSNRLYEYPIRPIEKEPKTIQLLRETDPIEESRAAAAVIRRLVRTRNYSYRDIAVYIKKPNEYKSVLPRAFSAYDVPVFMPETRMLDSHPLAQNLLLALENINKGFPTELLRKYVLNQYTPGDGFKKSLFANYIIKLGICGSRFFKEIQIADEDVPVNELEEVREITSFALNTLKAELDAALSLTDQLNAIYNYMVNINAYETAQYEFDRQAEYELWTEAGETGQTYERVIGVLDQMKLLLSDVPLSRKELKLILKQALSVVIIRALPQAYDAVQVQGISRVVTDKKKAVIIMGLHDVNEKEINGLLKNSELNELSLIFDETLAMNTGEEIEFSHRCLKSVIASADSYLLLTHPSQTQDNKPLRHGTVIDDVRGIYISLSERSGQTDEAIGKIKSEAPGAILTLISETDDTNQKLGFLNALSSTEGGKDKALKLINAYLAPKPNNDLRPETAMELYNRILSMSVTKLESFSKCPYSYFVDVGLKPMEVEPPQISAADEGEVLHAAMQRFSAKYADMLSHMTAEEAVTGMTGITDSLIEELMEIKKDTGATRVGIAETIRRRTLRAAVAIVKHLEGSKFTPIAYEVGFGENDQGVPLDVDGHRVVLRGRIDRVDIWENDGTRFARVIDYKRSGKTVDMSKLALGVQQQLIIYLAAVKAKYNAVPAGAFYFKVYDPIISSDGDNIAEIEKKRGDELRLNGIYINDETVMNALSPNIGAVIKDKSALSKDNIDEQIKNTLEFDCNLIKDMRRGAAHPAQTKEQQKEACEYCKLKGTAACALNSLK